MYNLKHTGAYLSVVIPLAGLGIILPRYTTSAPGGQVTSFMAMYLMVVSIALYGVFLGIQTLRHRSYFVQPRAAGVDKEHADDKHGNLVIRPLGYHALLPLTMLPIVLLSKKRVVSPILPVVSATNECIPRLTGLLVSVNKMALS